MGSIFGCIHAPTSFHLILVVCRFVCRWITILYFHGYTFLKLSLSSLFQNDQGILKIPHTIPIKFPRILSPTSPLFSGWNWTPKTFPFRTDDEKRQM